MAFLKVLRNIEETSYSKKALYIIIKHAHTYINTKLP